MDYLAASEFSRRPGKTWRRAEAGEAIAVTRRGVAVALVISLDLDEASVLYAHRAARFGAALRRLQDGALVSGAAHLTDEDIQAEIDGVREERRQAASGP